MVGGPASERRCSDWIPSPDHCHSAAEEERATVSHGGEGHLTASTQLTSQYMHLSTWPADRFLFDKIPTKILNDLSILGTTS